MFKFLPILSGLGLYLGAIGATYGTKFNGFYSDEKTDVVLPIIGYRGKSPKEAEITQYRKQRLSSLSAAQLKALGKPFEESYSKLKFLR